MLDESNYSVVVIGLIPFDLQDGHEGQRGKGYNNHALFGLPKRVIEWTKLHNNVCLLIFVTRNKYMEET